MKNYRGTSPIDLKKRGLSPIVGVFSSSYFGDPLPGDWAAAGGATDVIYAGEGNDHAWGGSGNDVIFGEGGNDYLVGDGGDDIITGGAGADTLYGGDGRDVYIFNRGDGTDSIYDSGSDNIIVFGEGINAQGITLRLGSLMLDLGNGDAIHIKNEDQANANGFDRNDVFNSSPVGSFEFADTVLFGRSKSEAANDANFGNSFQRRAA